MTPAEYKRRFAAEWMRRFGLDMNDCGAPVDQWAEMSTTPEKDAEMEGEGLGLDDFSEDSSTWPIFGDMKQTCARRAKEILNGN